jgi:hypothetical protein
MMNGLPKVRQASALDHDARIADDGMLCQLTEAAGHKYRHEQRITPLDDTV